MKKNLLRDRLAGVIGNLLEHYDQALFGLLAPFLAPLFFHNQDPLTALILTYGMLPLGFLTRPLGSVFFGWIGDRFGRRQALFLSLCGMGIVTIGMGCLPTYKELGIGAPLLLALGRMLQSFFAAGESIGGAIFVLERTTSSKRGFISGCYDASSMAGILLASALVANFSAQGTIEDLWRILFWAGGATAFIGMFLRRSIRDAPLSSEASPQKTGLIHALWEYKSAFFAILIASGFCYTTYSLAFTLMNGYIPLITSWTKADVMQTNTLLLVIDALLLPCFGYLSTKVGKEKIMLAGALGCVLFAVPLFSILEHASLTTIVLARLGIILCGVAFAAPYYAWAIERVPPRHRYLLLSLGGALGSQLIGAPTSAISLWLYQNLGWVGAPGLYLVMTGAAAALVILKFSEEPKASTNLQAIR